MILLVFVICLYINYSLTVPVYEGFDVVTDVLGGITTALFLFCCLIALFNIVRNSY